MDAYSRTHLSDDSLLSQLKDSFQRDRANTADLLADIAEVESRRLYLHEGYSSMFDYCVEAFGLSEQSALKRLRAARKARQHPAIFTAIHEGRLNLSGVVLMAPHLTEENADDLLRAAAGKRNFEIEILIAERFPRPDLPQRVRPIPQPAPAQPMSPPRESQASLLETPIPLAQPAAAFGDSESALVDPRSALEAARLAADSGAAADAEGDSLSVRTVSASAGSVENRSAGEVPADQAHSASTARPTPKPKITPLSAQRFGLQTTISQAALDDLHRAQLLLSHQIPTGDIAQVLERALRVLVVQLERTKLAATSKPRRSGATSPSPRSIPAHVRRAVWRRDGGQCTFTSESGHRCSARSLLELDHVLEVARGGRATLANLRLRCRAHNQYAAERAFGVEFMRAKRERNVGWSARPADPDDQGYVKTPPALGFAGNPGAVLRV